MNALTETVKKESLPVEHVRFEGYNMVISFVDGNELPVPLAWFPKLYYATPRQLCNYQVLSYGLNIRWPELDETLAVNELMR